MLIVIECVVLLVLGCMDKVRWWPTVTRATHIPLDCLALTAPPQLYVPLRKSLGFVFVGLLIFGLLRFVWWVLFMTADGNVRCARAVFLTSHHFFPRLVCARATTDRPFVSRPTLSSIAWRG